MRKRLRWKFWTKSIPQRFCTWLTRSHGLRIYAFKYLHIRCKLNKHERREVILTNVVLIILSPCFHFYKFKLPKLCWRTWLCVAQKCSRELHLNYFSFQCSAFTIPDPRHYAVLWFYLKICKCMWYLFNSGRQVNWWWETGSVSFYWYSDTCTK